MQVTAASRAGEEDAVTPLTLGRVVTVAMAAAQAGCSASLVQKAIRNRQLAATRVGRSLLIDAAELDRWIASRNGRR